MTLAITLAVIGWIGFISVSVLFRIAMNGWQKALDDHRDTIERIDRGEFGCCCNTTDDISVTITGIDECEDTHGKN